MTPSTDPKPELNSWKEIAAYLDVSQRTAQSWEKKGLPVHRLPGTRGRVFCSVAELDAWKHSASGLPDASSSPADSPNRTSMLHPRPLVRTLLAAMLVTVLAGGGVLWWRQLHPATATQPFDVLAQPTGFSVLDEHGQELWHLTQRLPHGPNWYREHELFWVGDLAGDGSRRVLAPGEGHRTLACYDAKGRELWRFHPGRAMRSAAGEEFAEFYSVETLTVLPRDQFAGPGRVLVGSIQSPYFPTQVALLDEQGRLVAEYWHSGHLHVSDLCRYRDRPAVAFGGIGNTTKEAELLVLDPGTMGGTSREADAKHQLVGPAPTGELARIRFPRSAVSLALANGTNQVSTIDIGKDEWVVHVLETTTEPMASLLYHFTPKLEFRHLSPSTTYEDLYRELRTKGKLDQDITADLARLRPH